ncbi:MAG: DUF6055 domain-containing protein [Pseudomonadota bacterium]
MQPTFFSLKHAGRLALSIGIAGLLTACGGGGVEDGAAPPASEIAAATEPETSGPATNGTSTETPLSGDTDDEGTSSTGSEPAAALTTSAATSLAPRVDKGRRVTVWAAPGSTQPPTVTPGTWRAGGPAPDQASYKLVRESAHFTFYSDEKISATDLNRAVNTLENTVWKNLFESNLMMPEPFFNKADKIKPAIHINSTFGLSGGAWAFERLGMWIGPGALRDHWGLTHEFTHAWQTWTSGNNGLDCSGKPNTCGWIYESHANFTPHQLPEYRNNVHCSEMLPNAPHLYLGSSRSRYCNWQFMEFLKDKYGPAAVTQIWTTPGPDPFANLQTSRGWTLSQFNDFFGDWAMHNVVWNYKATPAAFRNSYGNITQTDKAERLRRLMPLEALDANWAVNRRFTSPFYGSPQRLGYNVVRLYPASDATTVSVKFRGIDQAGSDAGFRWGLVATNPQFSAARYSAIQRGLDADLSFAVKPGEPLFLVVVATPTVMQPIVWDQDYATIWRYPYMIELANAWPQGFQNGQRDACPTGTTRHANGGGCAPASTPATVFVGPYATILPGGRASKKARIEDQAIVLNGAVTGGTVGGLSIIGSDNNAFTVSGSAQVRTAFYPLGFFEAGQGASGTLNLHGDVEYRGEGLKLSAGYRSGFVDQESSVGSATDINKKTTPTWRP